MEEFVASFSGSDNRGWEIHHRALGNGTMSASFAISVETVEVVHLSECISSRNASDVI